MVAFIAPPCETWSRVRGVLVSDAHADAGRHQPRVLRDEEALWGYDSLAVKELRQVLTGKILHCFALEATLLIALTGGLGLIEHPAEPTDLPGAASIWKLPITRLLETLPGIQRLRFAQGLMGSKTTKPTELLCANLPHILFTLHQNRVQTELPTGQAIRRDEKGRWLKEYAPALCRSIANSILTAFDNLI